MTGGLFRRLACRVGLHETPKAWEAPQASYMREVELGRQDGYRFTYTQYRCRYCGAWFDYGRQYVTVGWDDQKEQGA